MVIGGFDSLLTHWHPMRVSFVHMTKSKMTAPTITLVESDSLPGVYLIPQEHLVRDVKNRAMISNYEIKELSKDVHNVGKAMRPIVDSVIEGLKQFRNEMRTAK